MTEGMNYHDIRPPRPTAPSMLRSPIACCTSTAHFTAAIFGSISSRKCDFHCASVPPNHQAYLLENASCGAIIFAWRFPG
jgi:hypothetical protein